jgi:protein-S-isoprenylcysteine O-methyltransferase Ste14
MPKADRAGAKPGPLPPTYFLTALVLMAALHLLVPITRLLELPWTLLGLAPLVPGIWLNLLADKQFKKARTPVKPHLDSTALVTSGAYGMSRHPMYLGMTLILVGVWILLGTLSPLFVVPVFVGCMEALFIAPEERKMERLFEEDWASYRERVGRWV